MGDRVEAREMEAARGSAEAREMEIARDGAEAREMETACDSENEAKASEIETAHARPSAEAAH
jgi:hypothetical protein